MRKTAVSKSEAQDWAEKDLIPVMRSAFKRIVKGAEGPLEITQLRNNMDEIRAGMRVTGYIPVDIYAYVPDDWPVNELVGSIYGDIETIYLNPTVSVTPRVRKEGYSAELSLGAYGDPDDSTPISSSSTRKMVTTDDDDMLPSPRELFKDAGDLVDNLTKRLKRKLDDNFTPKIKQDLADRKDDKPYPTRSPTASTKDRLIRLGEKNPDLRKHLKPILDSLEKTALKKLLPHKAISAIAEDLRKKGYEKLEENNVRGGKKFAFKSPSGTDFSVSAVKTRSGVAFDIEAMGRKQEIKEVTSLNELDEVAKEIDRFDLS